MPGQPTVERLEGGQCLVGIARPSRQDTIPGCTNFISESAFRVGNRELSISANAVDPSIHISLIDQPPGGDVGVSLRDHLRFPGVPALPIGFGFGDGRMAFALMQRVHGAEDNPAFARLPLLP